MCDTNGESSSKGAGSKPPKGWHWQGDPIYKVGVLVKSPSDRYDASIDYRGGLAERASQVIGRKTTSLSLWRKSPPSLQSAHMLVEIEEILSLPKPPPPRGGLAMSVCLARCRVSGEDTWMLVLLSVPPHDARRVPMAIMKAGCRVALWDPMVEVLVSRSRVYLCSRFVILS